LGFQEVKMLCSNCGQELNEGTDICTKCGAKCNNGLANKNYQILTYLSLILSIVGIICSIVFQLIYEKEFTNKIWIIISGFRLFIYTGIILAIITLYKHKSKLAFIAGLIPCAYLVIITLLALIDILGFLLRNFSL
jgi:uncharacterized membrane protein YvbJ